MAALLFLMDGLLRNSSPVVLVVADPSIALPFANELYNGSVGWDKLPKVEGSLFRLETTRVARLNAEQVRSLCHEIAATRRWLYIENIDELLDSSGGHHFLVELANSVARGEPAMVIMTTQPEHLDRVRAAVPRLAGFAKTVEWSGQTDSASASQLTSIVAKAQDRDDSGWIVAVRFELAGPISPDASFDGDPASAGVLQLVDTVQIIDSADAPPEGAMIGFSPDAFTFTQEAAAFAAAALAAQRVIGRALQPGEWVTAARGLYYA